MDQSITTKEKIGIFTPFRLKMIMKSITNEWLRVDAFPINLDHGCGPPDSNTAGSELYHEDAIRHSSSSRSNCGNHTSDLISTNNARKILGGFGP